MTGALIVLAVTIMAWFAVGSVVNVRKGHAAMRWLQDGLPSIGERTTVRWLGTTSVVMLVARAKAPFEQVTVVVFLEPRDSPWLWWLSRRRGRRDTLIVRTSLRRTPAERFEVIDPSSWSGRDARRASGGERWSVRGPAAGNGLSTLYKYERSVQQADALVSIVAATGVSLRRLSVSPAAPHLELHVDLPPATIPAAAVFTALRTVVERASAT